MEEIPHNPSGAAPDYAHSNSVASAPPPPSEVKVRTMRSDLESITKSGGGLPHFENIKVASLSMDRGSASEVAAAKSKNSAVIILIVIAALVVLVALGYFVYSRFF